MAKRIRGSSVERAFEIWASLSLVDRAEFDARTKGYYRALRTEITAPEKRVGRPPGSRNKAQPRVTGARELAAQQTAVEGDY